MEMRILSLERVNGPFDTRRSARSRARPSVGSTSRQRSYKEIAVDERCKVPSAIGDVAVGRRQQAQPPRPHHARPAGRIEARRAPPPRARRFHPTLEVVFDRNLAETQTAQTAQSRHRADGAAERRGAMVMAANVPRLTQLVGLTRARGRWWIRRRRISISRLSSIISPRIAPAAGWAAALADSFFAFSRGHTGAGGGDRGDGGVIAREGEARARFHGS